MCGIAGIVSIRHREEKDGHVDLPFFKEADQKIQAHDLDFCRNAGLPLDENYLGGAETLNAMRQAVRALKKDAPFFTIFSDKSIGHSLSAIAENLDRFIDVETRRLDDIMGRLSAADVDAASRGIEIVRDIAWCLSTEIEDNIHKIRELLYRTHAPQPVVTIFKRLNTVLNSIDRLEVRGRDSAGISALFILDPPEFGAFTDTLDKANFMDSFRERTGREVLVNGGITVRQGTDESGNEQVAVAFTYKVAAEIGSLGDNVAFLRRQIKNDTVLQAMVNFSHRYFTISSHTRWASVGAISEPNCHPVDNRMICKDPENRISEKGIFHVCLNGDIDNYLDLKEQHERDGLMISPDISTDTKIIPLRIEHYLDRDQGVAGAFRLAVNDFKGSHAIAMHTDLAPGKLFLAQKGSGQAIFVGLSEDHYMSASEVYGFIEETSDYLKMDGEKTVQGKDGMTRGQIFILNQDSPGGPGGIEAMYYDGTPFEPGEADIRHTEITSRDIDRQDFPHYFLKEISESPDSVEKTLRNRWRILDESPEQYAVTLDDSVVPESLRSALTENRIRRIFFVGQGTAGVAAQACANILEFYMNDPSLMITSLKASELSGFRLYEDGHGMEDTLVIAISQSGTTTDTNRTVDMVRERGAHTLAIVNRRDSDITFKVDGVMYTSSGRDIEMSVASTKAFYSQIVAGATLGLFMAHIRGRRDTGFVTAELRQLLALPTHMRTILAMKEEIENSARRLAVTRTYWATVGSGPNKVSADEIRIKLSELCYKTISSDYVEDKKHIDLSSEPLIIVCAAGTRETVIGDIIKDTAIFRAHKAIPVIIANEGDTRFDAYAADVFHVPAASEHLAPVLNTLVGHIWGYYAALAINEGSRFLFAFREETQTTIDAYAREGLDVYELILEKNFREKMARFYTAFRKKRMENSLPQSIGLNSSADLTILFKYLAGKLPVTDFEIDFGIKGTARNMLDTLFECLGESINNMARPIDAIKHQAKTVTVGTSRISEKIEGLLFDMLERHGFRVSQLTTRNVIVLKNLQRIISDIQGTTLYRIAGLNLLGEPTDDTTIEVIKREGTSMSIPSRVDRDHRLKGSKRTIVQEGNVYIGKGRKDERSILCIPLLSATMSAANLIENIALLHISFKERVPLADRVKALGGKYEKLKNIVQENSVAWTDTLLDQVEIPELFGRSAEKVGEYIVSRVKQG
ncbi:glutamine--fructose-6-phosphate aminotransferase [Desulfonema ishimotonii]|uniref:Glutamine--fructose-6-phosphate aminotransferase [isomerizing] n=1 Tax=Desulfonema ishimotonii TaxID=45657 RepID=A0A401FQZ4_9BACT|nr:SIS domain-containing protein [Desulfonema ishimotonii]GBC59386.1 glutamine--fructose-6-phosphate aminotransferase [Desulfonema ishimotonii]